MTTYALDVEPLLDAGESPGRIAARLGIKPGSVGRALLREGRPELARPFIRERRRQEPDKGGVCECGAPTSRKGLRCRPCGYLHRFH